MAYDAGRYTAQTRNIEDDYAAKSAANTFSRTLSQQRGVRQIGDMRRDFGRQLPGFQANFGQRGLSGPNARSGVHSQAMNRYLADHSRNLGYAQQDLSLQDQQFGVQQRSLDSLRQQALADLEAQRQQDIAMAALNISAVRPLIGG